MKYFEQHAIATVPPLWKRYLDNISEIIKKRQVDNLNQHLSEGDGTRNIKFTYEEENEGKIPFLDTWIVRKVNWTVKLLVYQKSTHTD